MSAKQQELLVDDELRTRERIKLSEETLNHQLEEAHQQVAIELKKEAQRDYCNELQIPHFAPRDGVCWSCNKQIYTKINWEKASTDNITSCPHCCRSFCG